MLTEFSDIVFSVFPKESIAYIRTRSRDASFHKHTDHLTDLPGNIFMAVSSSVHKRLSKFHHCSCSEAIRDYAACVCSSTFTRLCHQHLYRCSLPGGRFISMKVTTVFSKGGQCRGSFFSHSMTKMSSWRVFCDKNKLVTFVMKITSEKSLFSPSLVHFHFLCAKVLFCVLCCN